MQKLKKQKIQEILDEQNAAIDADMASLVHNRTPVLSGVLMCLLSK